MDKTLALQATALRYFLGVVEQGSITAAAQHLHVTVSAVSRQITELESALDTTLFDRLPRGMRPTPAGQIVASYARRLRLDAKEIISSIDALHGVYQAHIRLICTSGFAINLIPAAIAAFYKQHPNISFSLQVAQPADISKKLINGEADIALTYNRATEKGIYIHYSKTAKAVIVMRPDHVLATKKSLSLLQIKDHAIALPDTNNTVRQLFDIACSNRQIELSPMFESNQFDTLFNLVQYANVLTIAGTASVIHRRTNDSLHYVNLQEPGINDRRIQVQTLNGRMLSDSLQAFIELLKEFLHMP